MWLGRFKAGDLLPLLVRAADPKSGAPITPSGQVYAVISGASGATVESVVLTIKDRFSSNWVFQRLWQLDADYTAGLYTVLYNWRVSTQPHAKLDTFEIVTGIEGVGAVIAMQSTLRPEARKLIYETADGYLSVGRNPS